MKHICNMVAGLLILAAAPGTASAADWWWVAGEPGSDEIWFVDADTIMSGDETSFSQLHLTRDGAPQTASEARLSCDEAANDPDDAIRRFVCATPEERNSLGAMLGPIPPEVSARIIFDAPAAPGLQGMGATN